MLPHGVPPGLGVAGDGVGVPFDGVCVAVVVGLVGLGGNVGIGVLGVCVGDVWITDVTVAVGVIVGLGPPDAVNPIEGVAVGVPGRPASAGRWKASNANAATASLTARIELLTGLGAVSAMVPSLGDWKPCRAGAAVSAT
jgi:hypothetical protein